MHQLSGLDTSFLTLETPNFGLTVCKAAVPDVWDMALGLRESMDELLAATTGV